MKRLTIIPLCFLLIILTGCTYFGATEDILISSPAELSVSRIETFDKIHLTTPAPETTTSSNHSEEPTNTVPSTNVPAPITTLTLNTSSKKIHYFDTCSYAKRIDEKNRKTASAEDETDLVGMGYTVCSWCAKNRG